MILGTWYGRNDALLESGVNGNAASAAEKGELGRRGMQRELTCFRLKCCFTQPEPVIGVRLTDL